MLSRADRDLTQRDRRLRGLAILLDVDAFLEELRRRAPSAALQNGRITYIRYKPGTSCLIGSRLQISGAAIDAHAFAFAPQARDKLLKISTLESVPGPLGPGWAVLDDLGIAVATFPNDRQLTALRRLADPNARRALLQNLLPLHPELWGSEFHTLRYKPERRYVARLMSGPAAAGLRIYGKDEYPMAQLRRDTFRTTPALRLPRPLGHSDRDRAFVLEWLHGRSLNEVIGGAPDFAAVAGLALAELHAQVSDGLPMLTKDAEIHRLLTLSPALSFLCPHLSKRMASLVKRVAEWIDGRPTVYSATHGDFYANQVLLGDGPVAVLDLDEAVRADPARDLGNFIAHAIYDTLQGWLPAAAPQRLRDGLLDGYRLARGGLPDGVDLYTGVALLSLVAHPFRERAPDWPGRIEAILRETEAILNESAHGRVVSAVPTVLMNRSSRSLPPMATGLSRAAEDAMMPFLARALDARQVEAACRQLQKFLRGGDLAVQAIRVVRHKPGRRCVIEYDIDIARPGEPVECTTLVGKARAQGLDTRTHSLAQALWNAGFNGTSRDGVCVPEPIGVLPEFQMWLQRKVPGPAATALLPAGEGVALAERIAAAIHELHEAGIPPARQHAVADELRTLEERLRDVARLHPEWARRLARVLEGCMRLGAALGDRPLRGIHRDFYADHVIVSGERLYLVDLDLYAAGDPAMDVGNFLGHVTELSLRTLHDPLALAHVEARLLDTYAGLTGPSDRAAALAYATLTLARHISLSTQFPERRPFAPRLLALCEQRLATTGHGEAVMVAPLPVKPLQSRAATSISEDRPQ